MLGKDTGNLKPLGITNAYAAESDVGKSALSPTPLPMKRCLPFSQANPPLTFPIYLKLYAAILVLSLIPPLITPHLITLQSNFQKPTVSSLAIQQSLNLEKTQKRESRMATPEDEVALVKVVRSGQDTAEGSLDKRVLVGRVIAQKTPIKAGMKNSIRKLWKEYELVQITDYNSNVCMFSFKTAIQASKVLTESPWFVLGNLAISSEFGNQTIILDEEGFPKNPTL